MSDDDQMERYRAAAKACETTVFWHAPRTPAEALRAVADDAEALGLTEWDVYAERGPVAEVERQVAELLGKPAVAFFPSGVMAQQAALRVWTDRSRSRRVAIPDLSHLLKHEDDGPRRLHGFEFEFLTTGRETATAEKLRALGPGLGAALVELPLRDAGCLLPTWEELSELSAAARELGVPLHADGARIWESQPFYDRPLAEIAGQFDSLYVSFYKGLEALSGAALAGPEDVVEEARVWRRRMGGTLFHLTPFAVSALAGLRDRLPRMGEYAAWARDLATELSARGLRPAPDPPHTNTFLVHAEGEAEGIVERVIAFMERERIQPCGGWWDAAVPGYVTTEVAVHDAALVHDPAQVADWFVEVTRGMTVEVLHLDQALPAMHEVASRLTPVSWQHPGQVTWSARYALPEDLDHGPVAVFRVDGAAVGWAWVESPEWMEWCVDPAYDGVAEEALGWFLGATPAPTVRTSNLDNEPHIRAALEAAGFVEDPDLWFVQHTLDLAELVPVPDVPGYTFRAVRPDEYDARAACHRTSWSETSKVSAGAYRRLMATSPYRADLDRVAVTEEGEMVASCCVWLDEPSGVALVEPVGCQPAHRRRGLASAVSLAALHAARAAGATPVWCGPAATTTTPSPAGSTAGSASCPVRGPTTGRSPDPDEPWRSLVLRRTLGGPRPEEDHVQLTRITATLGAVALGGVLVASTTTAGASAPTHQPQPAHQRSVVPDRFVPPTPHKLRPHSNLRMGLHCDSIDMSI